ncbi:MAG: hypothetical protein AAGD32_02770 [Planctomycetota bacterium]
MNQTIKAAFLLPVLAGVALIGCESETTVTADATVTEDHGHDHGHDGHDHGDHDHAHDHGEEADLGTAMVGDMEVAFAQGHGNVAAGKMCHLVVKLPYNDNGATVVRAWIGNEDSGVSPVQKAIYAPSHDDYDIHVMAPDELPEGAMWWIEVVKPDGTRVKGSVEPKM